MDDLTTDKQAAVHLDLMDDYKDFVTRAMMRLNHDAEIRSKWSTRASMWRSAAMLYMAYILLQGNGRSTARALVGRVNIDLHINYDRTRSFFGWLCDEGLLAVCEDGVVTWGRRRYTGAGPYGGILR